MKNKTALNFVLGIFLMISSCVYAATLGSEWKYITTYQENGKQYSFYYNENQIEYNSITGLIETQGALTFTTEDEKPIRCICFAKIDFDTNKHMQRWHGRRNEVDDRDLRISKNLINKALNVGRSASALLIPFDGGFTLAFINGFTEAAGEETTVNLISNFINRDFKNQEDTREQNKFENISSDRDNPNNLLYKIARMKVGLEPEWCKNKQNFQVVDKGSQQETSLKQGDKKVVDVFVKLSNWKDVGSVLGSDGEIYENYYDTKTVQYDKDSGLATVVTVTHLRNTDSTRYALFVYNLREKKRMKLDRYFVKEGKISSSSKLSRDDVKIQSFINEEAVLFDLKNGSHTSALINYYGSAIKFNALTDWVKNELLTDQFNNRFEDVGEDKIFEAIKTNLDNEKEAIVK